jgi:hypothetical protein
VTAAEVLEAARDSGLTIVVTEGVPLVRGRGPKPVELLEELRAHRAEVLALLAEQPTCAHCGARGTRLVGTYWSSWTEVICPRCVVVVTAEFEQNDTWPPVPWVE